MRGPYLMRRYGLIMSGGSMKKGRVIVGMSGGVDSSVAAYLLKEEGYDVTGVTMQIWQPESDSMTAENGGCCGLSAVEDARSVAAHIGIPHYVMNFRDVFQKTVIDYFVREYQSGRTPNPCIACNRYVKWESLLNKALAIGADYIATGHYARVVTLPDGRMTLREAPSSKDQTYALYQLTVCGYILDICVIGEVCLPSLFLIAAQRYLRPQTLRQRVVLRKCALCYQYHEGFRLFNGRTALHYGVVHIYKSGLIYVIDVADGKALRRDVSESALAGGIVYLFKQLFGFGHDSPPFI